MTRYIELYCKKAVLLLLKFYQAAVSPHFPPCCRFYPSCSGYAVQAVEKYGALRGGFLGFKRLLRCHPFSMGGYNPVP